MPTKNEEFITIEGIRTHNLKNINIKIPRNKITTITGVSGSGKSSLAFDTIYKEGQFRYIESLSSYLRQFFDLGERPEIDYCEGLSPAIVIEQNKRVGNSRSTVGTLTEIDDYLRLLFAKLSDIYCRKCGREIKPQNIDEIMTTLKQQYNNNKVYLLQEVAQFNDKKNFLAFVNKNRKKVDKGKGFVRYLVLSQNPDFNEPIEFFYLEDPNIPDKFFPIKLFGIYDRVTLKNENYPRLKEDIIKILNESNKFGVYLIENNEENDSQDNNLDKIQRFTDKFFCPNCNIKYPEFTTQHFSFNRQQGACPTCLGLGEVLQANFEKIIDTEAEFLKAIIPRRDSVYGQSILKKLAFKYEIPENVKRKSLPSWFQEIVLYGDDEVLRLNLNGKYSSLRYKGIEDVLKQQYQQGLLPVDFQAMLELKPCPTCNGAKLRIESLYAFLTFETTKKSAFSNFILRSINEGKLNTAIPIQDGKQKYNIQDLHLMTISELEKFLTKLQKNTHKDQNLVSKIIIPLIDRVKIIKDLGLGYLTLDRTVGTLSGGEIQRLRLAKQLGNKLTGIIYVLDEPTIGLSKKEITKAIKAIKQLKEMGNTVIVVEHNEAFIKHSDRIIEVGPGAGDFGGEVIFMGNYKDFEKSNCLTAKYIRKEKQITVNFEHKVSSANIEIKKAHKHNLKNIDVKFPIGGFTVITGPSGAGKTTLMFYTLYKFLSEKNKFIQSYIRLKLFKEGYSRQEIIKMPIIKKTEYNGILSEALQKFYADEIAVENIKGFEEIKNVVYVDQSSIGKTPRSCPATFIKVFDKIRDIYAQTDAAKYLGFTSSHFSFNSSKGACPACNGYGYKKIELQFLPDTYVECEVCHGKRYKSEVLEITWHGKTIADILEMYVSDAVKFFEDIDFIKQDLQLMEDIGLGYLKLGQPAHTLSGGESQRLKLVKHLLKKYSGQTIYFLDEPTVGLHFADIEKLLKVLKKFLDRGDTILMIEHDENILHFADRVIEIDDGKLKFMGKYKG